MKKIFCALLSCCLFFGCLPALAVDNTDVQMQSALAFVKSKIDIPQTLNQFSYQKRSGTAYDEKTVWTFTWTDETHNASLSAESIRDEQIIYYQYSAPSAHEKGTLADCTKLQGENNARAFLAQILPASVSAQDLFLTDSENGGNTWRFSFVQTVDSIPVIDHTVHVEVGKDNGAILLFNGFYENSAAYPNSKTDVISPETARKLFAEQIGIRLVYRSYYDTKSDCITVFPAYVLDTDSRMVMADGTVRKLSALRSSVSGEPTESIGAGKFNDLASSDNFSPQELEQLCQSNALLSAEQAAQKVAALFPACKGVTIKSAVLLQDGMQKGQYIWNFTWNPNGQYLFASVNAATGEIISYNAHNIEQKATPVSEETAKKALDALLPSLCGDKLTQSVQQAQNETVDSPNYTVRYIRRVNGIDYENNTITATFDRCSGSVTSFRCTWYPNVVFPDISKVKSTDEMLTLLFEQLGYSKVYRDIDGVKYFGYDFPEITNAMFHPISAKRIGYNGHVLTDDEKPHYTDIDLHWCCDMALTLLDNDVYFPGGTLNPDALVTQEDFLRLLYRSQQFYAAEESDIFYQDVVRRNILNASEVSPAGTVSRADAARYIVRILGLEQAATLNGIYTSPFADTIAPADLGYAALCFGLGIINGDANGNFNATASVTRAETISMIYHKMLA